MFEGYDFIEEMGNMPVQAFIQCTGDKKIMFHLVDNEIQQTEVTQLCEGSADNLYTAEFEDKNGNIHKIGFPYYSIEEFGEAEVAVLTWAIEDDILAFTCLLNGEIKVMDLKQLYTICFSHHKNNPYNGLWCEDSNFGRTLWVHSFKGDHGFNLDLYERRVEEKFSKFDERVQAKYALLGGGVALLTNKGELVNLEVGRSGNLQIPPTCKIIKKGSILEDGVKILKIGAGVEKCEEYPFYAMGSYDSSMDLEFNGTSAKVVREIFLEYYFHTVVGSGVKYTAIKVKSGLSEVLTGMILAISDKRFGRGDIAYNTLKEFPKYFESGNEFNICESITKEEVIEVLDNIVEYVNKNFDKPLEFTDENIAYHIVFSRAVFEFKANMRGLLTKEENRFYNKALRAIYKVSTNAAVERLRMLFVEAGEI